MPSAVSTPTPEATRKLRAALQDTFSGELRFDRLSRALYATDASLYEIAPVGVACPRSTADVVALVRAAAASGIPLVPRGAGTGISGGAVGAGLQVDFSRFMHSIERIDPARRIARVQPGVVLGDLNRALAPHGLEFGPNVATASRATFGGMIANNSCGSHSVYHGRTVDHVAALTVVLADGSVETWQQQPTPELQDGSWGQVPLYFREHGWPRFEGTAPSASTPHGQNILVHLERIRTELHAEVAARYPRVLRRNGGYALDRLCASAVPNPATILCGSEGTLGLVVAADVHLVPLPPARALVVLHFDSHLDAVAATPDLLRHDPAAVELVDQLILEAGAPEVPAATRDAFLVGMPAAILVCEFFASDQAALEARLGQVLADVRQRGFEPVRVVRDAGTQAAVWDMRNRGFGLLTSRPGDDQPHEFIEDAAVAPERLADYIRDLDAAMAEEGVTEVAHYAHASVGVIHVRPVLNLKRPAGAVQLRRVAERTLELVLRYGGAMTGEHGDGIVRSEWLGQQYGPRILAAFTEIKRAFDPLGIFNPNKIVDPLPMDARLRRPPRETGLPVRPVFDYGGHAGPGALAGMCSGVGQCRQKQVGTMCPSYMATLDEQHTTRARANALRVALADTKLLDGLADDALADVMDLCLSCKACKSECPTGVDMGKLKAEWLHARHAVRGATAAERFFGHAGETTRWAGRSPGLANWLAARPLVQAGLARWFGLDRRLPAPVFVDESFQSWWRQRTPPRGGSAGRVLYLADTWMNYHQPQVGRAAVRLLEAFGFEVIVPQLGCCGRPLIGKGFLDEARDRAEDNLWRLEKVLGDGWIVGSEPSCVSMLLDEYPALVPGEPARRIAGRTRMVESLLVGRMGELSSGPFEAVPPKEVLLHGHCHQKALLGTADTINLLNAVPGIRATALPTGCCGMAGSFGHEARHYEVARAVGEERLFPAVRGRGSAEVVVTGFSCREQIAHHTDVVPRHALEVAAEGLAVPVGG